MLMTKSMGKPSCTQGTTGTGVQKCTESWIATEGTEPITTDEKTRLKTDSQQHSRVKYNPF